MVPKLAWRADGSRTRWRATAVSDSTSVGTPKSDTARSRPRILGDAFRLQRLNDFYYAWSATAADVNQDGVLDVIAGPHYFLGPDYRVSRELFLTNIKNPGTEYAGAA